MVEQHKIGVGAGGAADVDAIDVVALGAFKDRPQGLMASQLPVLCGVPRKVRYEPLMRVEPWITAISPE